MAKRRSMACEEEPNEQEAIALGLAIVGAKWDGDSDFDRGMRLLQERLFRKKGESHDGPEGDDRKPAGGT